MNGDRLTATSSYWRRYPCPRCGAGAGVPCSFGTYLNDQGPRVEMVRCHEQRSMIENRADSGRVVDVLSGFVLRGEL